MVGKDGRVEEGESGSVRNRTYRGVVDYGWKDGTVEEWRVEEGNDGRMEGWKDGRMEGFGWKGWNKKVILECEALM